MKQIEFDRQMNLLNQQETEEKLPLSLEIDRLQSQRQYLGQQICSLNAQIWGVRNRINELLMQRKAIGGRYYKLKKQLIQRFPRENGNV